MFTVSGRRRDGRVPCKISQRNCSYLKFGCAERASLSGCVSVGSEGPCACSSFPPSPTSTRWWNSWNSWNTPTTTTMPSMARWWNSHNQLLIHCGLLYLVLVLLISPSGQSKTLYQNLEIVNFKSIVNLFLMSFTKRISQLGLACKFYGMGLGGFEDTLAVIKLNAIARCRALTPRIYKL